MMGDNYAADVIFAGLLFGLVIGLACYALGWAMGWTEWPLRARRRETMVRHPKAHPYDAAGLKPTDPIFRGEKPTTEAREPADIALQHAFELVNECWGDEGPSQSDCLMQIQKAARSLGFTVEASPAPSGEGELREELVTAWNEAAKGRVPLIDPDPKFAWALVRRIAPIVDRIVKEDAVLRSHPTEEDDG